MLIEESSQNLDQLSNLAAEAGSQLVFFVGAGISSGPTMMPRTTELIARLVEGAVAGSPRARRIIPRTPTVKTVGFETVLNDLWQVCRPALDAFMYHLSELDEAAVPSRVHAFLGEWLASGHSVITTNYDRIIESTWKGPTRFDRDAVDETGFSQWERDLQRGTLFKIHGSLARTSSCLAALEHVGTTIAGARRDLLQRVFHERPLCFVGWRGVDPDVPPLLRAALAGRPRDLPLFWVHHSADSLDTVSPLLREAASLRPIVGTASEIFDRLDADGAARARLVDVVTASAPRIGTPEGVRLDGHCTASALARFAGIAFRRAGHERVALRAFDVAAIEAQRLPEWVSAREERALTLWASAHGGDRGEMAARSVLRQVVSVHRRRGVRPADMRGPLFGYLSMTVSLARRHHRFMPLLPSLLYAMRSALREARANGADSIDLELQEMLTDLYEGRVRLLLAGTLARRSATIQRWVLSPYRRARRRAVELPERSLHARFDVLAGHALVLARIGDCRGSLADVDELERLSLLLSDPRRLAHWDDQRSKIARYCPPSAGRIPDRRAGRLAQRQDGPSNA